MRVGGLGLHLRPQSFFQTNTQGAAALYARGAAWVADVRPRSVWDLYCGVGGFALAAARALDPRPDGSVPDASSPGPASPGPSSHAGATADGLRPAVSGIVPGSVVPDVVGVELSEEAIVSATLTASSQGIPARFVAGDATAFALSADPDEVPDLVIVNPPRRGIGEELAGWLESSGVPNVLYSSCNARTLASDLRAMPSLTVREAVVLDMFPQTPHYEVATLLSRDSAPRSR